MKRNRNSSLPPDYPRNKFLFEENKKVINDVQHKKENQIKKFLLGFANSIFQASGDVCGDSNWTQAFKNGTVPSSEQSIKHWHNFESDLDHMAEMGINSYRFTIEWSHIEPKQGEYDQKVLSRYREMIHACHIRNIQPMLTLYHFHEPLWFTQLGSFEREENIRYFGIFCETMFKEFSQDVTLWCTINEPTTQAFLSYLYGRFPPHRHNVQKTVSYLKNLLKAHVEVYKKLKQLPNGEQAQIGIAHHVLRFVPRYWWEPIERLITSFLTTITNDLVIQFLKTGHYDYDFFPLASEHYYDPTAPSSFDFIGLNFYANAVIGFNSKNFFGPTCFPHQEMGNMYLPIDPQGFAKAIDEIAVFNKPIYITETGFADESDKLRGKFLREYFNVLIKKRQEGLDIRGCYLWTFVDNYEWNEGFSKKFGLFDHSRTKRKSAQEFIMFIERHKQQSISQPALIKESFIIDEREVVTAFISIQPRRRKSKLIIPELIQELQELEEFAHFENSIELPERKESIIILNIYSADSEESQFVPMTIEKQYDIAMDAFHKGNYQVALELFKRFLLIKPEDQSLANYIHRCRRHLLQKNHKKRIS